MPARHETKFLRKRRLRAWGARKNHEKVIGRKKRERGRE